MESNSKVRSIQHARTSHPNANGVGAQPDAGNKPAILSSAVARKQKATLLDRTASAKYPNFEYSVHLAPRGLIRDVRPVFPGIDLTGLLVIPTFQKSAVELLQFGEKEAFEKDRLLESFLRWASALCDAVQALHPAAWVDATDPSSGLAYFGTSGSPYSDVDGLMRVTTSPTTNIGGCHIVRHPEWAFSCYPATVFTTVNPEVLLPILAHLNANEIS